MAFFSIGNTQHILCIPVKLTKVIMQVERILYIIGLGLLINQKNSFSDLTPWVYHQKGVLYKDTNINEKALPYVETSGPLQP